MKRLYIDIKENCKGEIAGRVSMSADSLFVLEALALVIEQFSESCGVHPCEIAKDLEQYLRK